MNRYTRRHGQPDPMKWHGNQDQDANGNVAAAQYPAPEPQPESDHINLLARRFSHTRSAPADQDPLLEITCEDGSTLVIDLRSESLDYSRVPYNFQILGQPG